MRWSYPEIEITVSPTGNIIIMKNLPTIYNGAGGIYMTESWNLINFKDNVAVFKGPPSSEDHASILEKG